MLNENLQRKLILLCLALLMGWAFTIRMQSIVQSKYRSIDEMVYHQMAGQVQWGWEYYDTIPYGRRLAATGRELPEYFFRPLYKHPPLFTMFNLLSYKIFGITEQSPFYVALTCGVMMIPLVYLIGSLVFGRVVGLAAAVIMTFDPIGVMVSQKMWMDSMIGMFIVFSLYAFLKAIDPGCKESQRSHHLVSSGILSGFGALTKYTGALATPIIFIYALFFDRRLFRNKWFWAALVIPVLMLIPWLVWNLQVYGMEFFGMQAKLHSDKLHTQEFKKALMVLAGACAAGLIFYFKVWPRLNVRPSFAINLRIAAGCATAVLLWEAILMSFNPWHLPTVSWSGATFYGSSHAFYLQRLLEWNLIFFFAMLAFFIPHAHLSQQEIVLRIGFVVVLVVFTAWGAFQSRYVIAAVPLGILIGTNFLVELFRAADDSDSVFVHSAGRAAVVFIAFIILMRMLAINYAISYTNNMCYF